MTEADKTDPPAHDATDDRSDSTMARARKGASRPRKAAAPGTLVPSSEVTQRDGAVPETAPAPSIGSTLVGDGSEGLPPAARRTAEDDVPPDLTETLESPPPVTDDGVPDLTPAPTAPDMRPAMVETAPVQAEPRRGGFLPLVLGGVIAAGLGSAATLWAVPQMMSPAPVAAPELPRDEIAALAQDAAAKVLAEHEDALVARAEDVARAEVEALLAAQPAAEVLPPPPPPPIDLSASPMPAPAPAIDMAALDALEARVAEQANVIEEQTQRLAEQDDRIAELAARPVIDPAQVDRVQTLTDQAEALEDQIKATAEDAQAAITAAQGEAEDLRSAAEEATRRAEAVAAVAAIQNALDQGVSTEAAVAGLEQAGVATPEALRGEVPTLATLQADYDPAARAALRAALRAQPADDGAVGVIGNFLRSQTGARSVAPRDGTDPDAVLSRAGAAVAGGDIDAALAEIATLPDAARAVPEMADWLGRADAYRAARGAVEALAGGQAAGASPAAEGDAAAPAPPADTMN